MLFYIVGMESADILSTSARSHVVRTARMTRSARFARAFSFLSGLQQL